MSTAKGKTIVITGCSRGLGRAMAEYFISHGARVAGCSRQSAEIETLNQLFGPEHEFSALDVSRDEQVQKWAEQIRPRFGAPDLLINNAAVTAPNAPLWEVSAAEFDRVTATNLNGTANVIRHFVPAMIQRGEGLIVNFSSGWGRSTSPEVAPYCASKWAIEGLTQALAQDLAGKKIAAVALNPGIIDTEMLRSCFGSSAGDYPPPSRWAQQAGPFLLKLSFKHNGQSLDVPGIPLT